ncbi:hypothetical protein K8Q96_00050 [Candidatus Nomurabacteria bacterium]|nr:hypothetical protein [Candidatus Nomurabacteria bacterium]
MKITRRQTLLVVWAVSIVITGVLVHQATASTELGWAASLALLAMSLGVPLMRAFTEFSK